MPPLIYNDYDQSATAIVDAHVRSLFSAGNSLVYNSGSGQFTLPIGGVNTVLFTTAVGAITGSNKLLWDDVNEILSVTGQIDVSIVNATTVFVNGATANRLTFFNAFKSLTSATVSTPLDFTAGALTIPNNAIAYGKIQQTTQKSLLGNATGAGNIEEIVVTTGLQFGTVLGVPTLRLVVPIPVASGGTGLTTFGGVNTVLFTSAADTLAWSTKLTFDDVTGFFSVGPKIILQNSGFAVFGGDGVTVGRFEFDGVGGWDVNSGNIALDADIGNESLSIGNIGMFAATGNIGTSGIIEVHFGGKFQGDGSLLTTLNASELSSGTVPNARLTEAVADGATKGIATFTAADFNSAAGVISLDYTNGQKATASVPGFLSSADWTTFNNKQSALTLPLTVSNGGTGVSTFTAANRLVYSTAATTLTGLASTASRVLVTDGSGVPNWNNQLPDHLGIGSAADSIGSLKTLNAIWIGGGDGSFIGTGSAFGFSLYTGIVLGQGNGGALMACGRAGSLSLNPFTGFTGYDWGSLTAGTGRSLYFGGGAWDAPDANYVEFYTAPTYTETKDTGVMRMKIWHDGTVSIGGGSQPGALLEVIGKMFIGVTSGTSATAKLHLGAGSSTANTAPLKLTSGTNLTTAEAGAFEYNGTNLFFTRTGTTRENVCVGNAGAAAPATNAIGILVDYFGTSATRSLNTPNDWLSVVLNGTTYKIPLYT